MKALFENKEQTEAFTKKYDEIDIYINYYQKLKASFISNESYYGDAEIEEFEDTKLICFSEYHAGCGDYEREYFSIPYEHLSISESQLIEIFKEQQVQNDRRFDIQNRWNIRNSKMEKIRSVKKKKEKEYKRYIELKEQFGNVSN